MTASDVSETLELAMTASGCRDVPLRQGVRMDDILRRELPLMLIVSLLAGCVFYDGVLSYSDGIFLLALAVIWLLYSVKIARLAEKQGQDSLTREQVAELPREGTLPVALLWLGVALIIMPMATRMVVDNATVLANYFAISELTIGLTVDDVNAWPQRIRAVSANAVRSAAAGLNRAESVTGFLLPGGGK
jgi:hypothetical protein